jgi:predicted enzyme related to lactoylglutathione lyase
MIEQDSIPGINGGLMRRQGPSPTMGQPLNSYVCSIVVDSIDESFVAAHAKNAMIAVPKMAIPNVGGLAYIIGTEGNIVSIMQADPTVSTI